LDGVDLAFSYGNAKFMQFALHWCYTESVSASRDLQSSADFISQIIVGYQQIREFWNN
jgi:hypothetical protein